MTAKLWQEIFSWRYQVRSFGVEAIDWVGFV